jgi:cohesin complex subunit SA-1/2
MTGKFRTYCHVLQPMFVFSVFLHRHRDFDPAIRMECIHAMGRWFKKHPSHFLNQDCLRYVEWVLSDASTPVRVASVQALQQAYSNGEYVQSFTTFTERCKSRLVEMAQRDTDLSVRTSVIDVLTTIDEHGQLSEEQRDELCLLVFDEEPRIRYAVAGFVRGVWKEARDQSLVTKKVSEKETLWAGAKTLAGLLIQWGKMLVKAEGESDVMDDDESQSRASSSMLPQPAPVYQDTSDRGRTALVVKALWEEVDVVSEWRDLLELLLLDHSAESDSSQSAPARDRRQKNAKATTSSYIKDAWRLEEDQEGVLLEVLVGALQHIATKSTSNKKVPLISSQ